jgi:hypothetical protein
MMVEREAKLVKNITARHFYRKGKASVMNTENNKDPKNNIPQNDPSKAMDSKKEVEQSPDSKTDQDFPGYPHYPAKEDIMDQRTESHRVDADVENMPAGPNRTGVSQRFASSRPEEPVTLPNGVEDELDLLNTSDDEVGQPHNVSNEDLKKINERGQVLDEIENMPEDENP